MEKKWTRSVRSMIALLLCAAMLLPMLPQVVVRADTTGSTSGFSGTIVESTEVKATVTTDTKNFQLVPVTLTNSSAEDGNNWLISGESYAIGNYDGTQLLAYSAVGKTEPTASNAGNAGIVVQPDENGIITVNPIDRDEVMWILSQSTANSETGAFANTGGKSILANESGGGWQADNVFQRFTMTKGTGGYWYSSENDVYRYLDLNTANNVAGAYYTSAMFNNTASGDAAGYRIEYYGDGVFQIFYADSYDNSYGARDFNFLKWDSNWMIGSFYKTNQKSDAWVGDTAETYSNLHLKLYYYDELNTYRTLNYEGYNHYDVMQGETVEDIVARIQSDITMVDTDGYTVEYSGTTAKVGYYWLDTSEFTSNEVGEYTVTVKYSNDDGSDTSVDDWKITVKIADITMDENLVGYISKNSQYNASVYDGVAATANEITMSFANQTVPVTVNMLYTSYNAETKTGTRLDLTKPDTYTGVKVVSNEKVIGTMTIVIANGTIAAHTPISPDKGSVDVDKSAYVLNSVTDKGDNLANIQLSALGTEKETGVDLIVVLDLSSSMRYGADTSYEVCGPYYDYTGNPNVGGYTLNTSTNTYSWGTEYKDGTSTDGSVANKILYYDGTEVVKVKKDNSYLPYNEDAWKNTRMYDLEESLKEMLQTLQGNNTTDVRIAITDFGDLDHYEFTDAVIDSTKRVWPVLDGDGNNQMNYATEIANHLNFVLGRDDIIATKKWNVDNGESKTWISQPYDLHEWKYFSSTELTKMGVASDFQGKQDPTIYTALDKKTVSAEAFVDVNDLQGDKLTSLITDLRISNSKMLGTNYDVGLEYAYKLAYERQQANIANGEDREIICVFMSDGAAMQYNYFSGRSITEAWSQMIIGETDEVLTGTVTDNVAANLRITKNDAGEYVFVNYKNITPKLQYILGFLHRKLSQDSNSVFNHNDTTKKLSKCNCEFPSDMSTLQSFGESLPNCLATSLGGTVTWYDIMRTLSIYGNYYIVYNGLKDYYFNVVANDIKSYPGVVSVTNKIGNGTVIEVELKDDIMTKNADGTYSFSNSTVTYPRDVGTNGEVPDDKKTESWTKSMQEIIREVTAPNNGEAYQTMSPYYYFYNADGKNWWAEAIKGDTDKVYPVINKYAKGKTATDATNPIGYNGEEGYTDNFDGVDGVSDAENTTYYTDSSGNRQPLALSGKDYISGFQGLGMRLYTIGFAIQDENLMSAEEANTVLKNLASGPNYYYSTENRGELTTALNSIVGEVTQGATFGYFTDTMGEEFDLYTRFTEDDPSYKGTYYDADGVEQDYDIPREDTEAVQKAVIRVFKADKTANVTTDDHQVTNTQYTPENDGLLEEIEIIEYGVAKSIVYEYVTNTDGSITTQKIETDDVWDETRNIIQGTYVVYNLNKTGTYLSFTKTDDGTFTTPTEIAKSERPDPTDPDYAADVTAALYAGSVIDGTVMINLDSDAELDFRLKPETFFWTIGNIPQDYRIVLEYQAYMEESMEGTLPLKDQYYDTNEQATLTYVDYLGNLVTKDTVSPELPWKEQALYKYAYYKVNVNGQPVDIDGNVTSDPTKYVYITKADGSYYTGVVSSVASTYTGSELTTTIDTDTVANNRPDGYDLYDSNAGVTIKTFLAHTGENDIKVPDKHTITPNAATQGLIATTLVNSNTEEVPNIENGKLRNNIIYFAVYVPPTSTTIKYSFYLVDESGNPVDKTGTPTNNGWSGAFKLKDGASTVEVKVGKDTLTLTPEGKLADYCEKNGLEASLFEIYDASATAAVTADYTAPVEHKVTLSKGEGKNASTYIDIDTADTEPTNETGDHTITGADALTTTEISFAVKLKSQAEDDVIVVDFGLPVNISVLANDKLTSNLTLNGINSGAKGEITAYNTHDGNYGTEGFGEQYGSVANIANGDTVVNYTPTTMIFDGYDLFSYEAKYTSKVTDKEGTETSTYYFYTANVTVIPATTIYYEDNVPDGTDNTLITYKTFKTTYDANGNATRTEDDTFSWDTVNDGTSPVWEQDEDRPDTGAINIDANNVYGMDSHYKSMAQYSMGSAHMVHVDAGKFATAQFDFTGTGFDVISLTDNTTGTIMVTVYEQGEYEWENPNTGIKAAAIVDTFYGYTYSDGIWTPSSEINVTGRLYQVPVIKMSGLEYGKYTAVITVTYMEKMDQTAADGYDFYLDAIRIYDPADDGVFKVQIDETKTTEDTTIRDAYIDDDEGWPEYFELRNLILDRGDLNLETDDGTVYNGVVFIDKGANTNEFAVSDYHNYGPNNELYLAPGQSIAFDLNVTDENLAGIHMAVKSVGEAAELTYKTPLIAANADGYVLKEETINSATDLYYDITTLNKNTVVISNTGTEGILSITNMKVTYTADTSNNLDTGYLSIATSNVVDVLEMMGDQVSGSEDGEIADVDTITITSASLSLAGKVYVNYYFTVGDLTIQIDDSRVTNAGLLIWNSDPGVNPKDTTADTKVVGAFTTTENRYVAQTPGIAAKDLGNTLYTRVYVEDEDGTTYYSEVRAYSPRTYAYNMLKRLEDPTVSIDNDVKLKQLCAALLNYGAAAQVYFDANEVPLANNELYKYNVTVPEYDAVGFDNPEYGKDSLGTDGGFSEASISVSFDGALALNYYFKPSKTVSGNLTLYYWDSDLIKEGTQLSTENATGEIIIANTGNSTYSYTLPNITSKEIGKVIYAAAVYSDGSTIYTTGISGYSVYNYCDSKANGTDPDLAALAKATAVYGYCAKQYFDAVSQ